MNFAGDACTSHPNSRLRFGMPPVWRVVARFPSSPSRSGLTLGHHVLSLFWWERKSTPYAEKSRTAPRRSKSLWGAGSEAYFRVDELLQQLANPNLHDIPHNLPFRVEMWDQSDQYVRWVISASASVAIGYAALDAAIANYPDQRFTLRNGIVVIRQHPRLKEV